MDFENTPSQMLNLVAGVLQKEGGFVNHPADRGGPTNFGITQKTLAAYRGKPVSLDDVRSLTKGEATRIYIDDYYLKPGVWKLPQEVQEQVFDMCVNHGQKRAFMILQEALNTHARKQVISVDGKIGPLMINATEMAVADVGNIINNFIADARITFYERLIRNDPSQEVFRRGWMNRANSFKVQTLH